VSAGERADSQVVRRRTTSPNHLGAVEGALGSVELAATTLVGPLDAPPIVFLHGTRVSKAVWVAQQGHLKTEFRTIAVDLPGHGANAAHTFTLDRAADIVAGAIEAHTPDGRAIVVGLSLGGYVAMHLAARQPALVRGLVLSGATAEPIGFRALGFLAVAEVIERADPERLDRLSAWFFRTRFPPAIAEPIVAGGFWSVGGAAALRALTGERFIPRLAAYPGPALLLNGQYDVPFRLWAPLFAAAAHDARRVRLAGATHLANLDRPAAFSEAVRRFASSLGPD
jgi:pimeloyl-ACP methyl ester carboxylesterase